MEQQKSLSKVSNLSKNNVLERFMKEFFPYREFKRIGFFTKEMKGNYEAQAKKVCDFFGFKTVYEYGAMEIRCHVSYGQNERPLVINSGGKLQEEPFITCITNIYV